MAYLWAVYGLLGLTRAQHDKSVPIIRSHFNSIESLEV